MPDRAVPARVPLETLVLRRAAQVSNRNLALDIRADEPFVSRFLSGDRGLRLPQLEAFLAAIGLRVIEADNQEIVISAEEYQALVTLARKGVGLMADEQLTARVDVAKCGRTGPCPLAEACLRALRPVAAYQAYSAFDGEMTEDCQGFQPSRAYLDTTHDE